MEFPMLVYKDGGPHQRQGGTFSHRPVHDAQEMEAALADGWHASLLAALEKPAEPVRQPEDAKPPTRDELEQKAKELDIPFSPRVSDKKLREAIEAKLKD